MYAMVIPESWQFALAVMVSTQISLHSVVIRISFEAWARRKGVVGYPFEPLGRSPNIRIVGLNWKIAVNRGLGQKDGVVGYPFGPLDRSHNNKSWIGPEERSCSVPIWAFGPRS
ncbi:hypothetical protein HS088_TW03G01246 [Tripterygium wilfordii]|uniref:Uncharacterized protein n=1 Tax=Tripterygium wilfordii TaxID=458696 RepID=A0A7J7DXS4_TRIWF|nr:hypothetical protein HS088_TW03G01246 [Tripterygium wilfordii]